MTSLLVFHNVNFFFAQKFLSCRKQRSSFGHTESITKVRQTAPFAQNCIPCPFLLATTGRQLRHQPASVRYEK